MPPKHQAKQQNKKKAPKARPTVKREVKKDVKHEVKKVVQRVRAKVPVGKTPMATKLAMAIALPGTCPNLRLRASPADSMPTACTSCHLLTTVKTPAADVNYPSFMPTGTSFVALFRDPLRSIVQYVTACPAYTYTLQFRDFGAAVAPTFTVNVNQPWSDVPVDALYATSATAGAPHGPTLYMGRSGGHSYIWLDKGSIITVTQSAVVAANMSVYAYNGEDDPVFGAAFAAGSWSYTCAAPLGQYVRLVVIPLAATAHNLTIVLTGVGDSFAHLAIPNIQNHYTQLVKARVNAASLMASPVASVLNQGGTITAGNLEGNVLWNSVISTSLLTSLPVGEFDERLFTKGMYTYLRPSSLDELSMVSYAKFDSLSTLVPSELGFPLDNNFRYVVMLLTTDVVGAVAPGLEYLRTSNWDLEYQTPDQWFEDHRPPGTYFDAVEALRLLETVELFHDNPLHFSDVKNALRGGFNFMRKHARKVTSAFSALFPQYSAPATVAGEFLNALPEL
jgi:hypothetical protein